MNTPYIAYRGVSTHEAAMYGARTSLEELLAWFVEDGFSEDDLRDACDEAIERATEDTDV